MAGPSVTAEQRTAAAFWECVPRYVRENGAGAGQGGSALCNFVEQSVEHFPPSKGSKDCAV